MVFSIFRRARPQVAALFSGMLALAASAGLPAQTVEQTLDSIAIMSPSAAQGIVQTPALKRIAYGDIDPSAASPGFDALRDPAGQPFAAPVAGQGASFLSACQLSGTRGLYCLNTLTSSTGATLAVRVLHWQDPDRQPLAVEALTCSALGLAECSGLAVDLAGRLYVAGRAATGTTFNVISATACAAAGGWCSSTLATGRARLSDLSIVDGELAYGFRYLKGVLAIEGAPSSAATFFPLQGVPVTFPFSLANREFLQGATLLQRQTTNDTFNYVLATTSTGRVLGFEVRWDNKQSKSFDTLLPLSSSSTAGAPIPAAACTSGSEFRLRASARTDRLYFTTGDCVAGFDPQYGTTSKAPPVAFPTENRGFVISVATAEPSQAATTDSPYQPGAPAITQALTGVTISPGIAIDFVRDGCTSEAGCAVIGDGADTNDFPGAKLARIKLADEAAAGWLVYQVTGMPDCRYLAPRPALCVAGSVLDVDGNPDATFNPTRQYLNITPLLPEEVRDSFEAGQLPPMLLQPEYRARQSIAGATGRTPYTFDALFGIPEKGLVYRDTFEGAFDVHDLLGGSQESRCGGGALPASGTTAPAWDVVVNISELSPTVGGPNVNYSTSPVTFKAPYAANYVSMLLNDGCTNPTRLAGGRGSAFVYGLELAPSTATSGQWIWYDSRQAALVRSLARDFDAHLHTYACTVYTGSTPTPLSSQTCNQLQKDWPVVYDKLRKCVNATDQPKNSSGSEACGAFETQFAPFRQSVLAVTLNGSPTDPTADRNNYVGELKARIQVLEYVYTTQFKPSLKPGGFVNPNPVN